VSLAADRGLTLCGFVRGGAHVYTEAWRIEHWTGVLLVGGASLASVAEGARARREETMAERSWRILGEACRRAHRVGKHEYELRSRCSTTAPTSARPIVGLVAGLRSATYDVVVVLPVDTPTSRRRRFMSSPMPAAMRRSASGPLPGSYRRSALPVLEAALAEGG